MTSFDWALINLCMAIIIGMLCWFWGFCSCDRFSTNYFNWSKGWDDCRDAIMKGLSEESKKQVEQYTGRDEGNEDC